MPVIADDSVSNESGNDTFRAVVAARTFEARLSDRRPRHRRRGIAGGVGSLLNAVPASAQVRRAVTGIRGIPVSSADTVVVPPGYTAKVLIAWGDPVSDGPAFRPDASNSAADQAQQWGMHNDGLVYFPIHGSTRGLLVQNNEYTDDVLLFPDGTANWNQEKTNKSLERARRRRSSRSAGARQRRGRAASGRSCGLRATRAESPAMTPIRMGGPVAQRRGDGGPAADHQRRPDRPQVLGTMNNCAMGFTPWGTYLACEENFNGYFRKNGPQTPLERRYGITPAGAGYLWHTTDKRFRASTKSRTSRTGSAGSSRSIRSIPPRRR